ncbi:MAG TPA: hypothetical protein VMV47_10940 [Bacteroidales bacterium]|nr:hypothetical protein [Bacteroidales bacterium]
MIRILVLFISAVFICNCSGEPEKIIGVKIYEYSGDYEKLVSQWEKMGINTAFVSIDLAADTNFRKAFEIKGIKVFIIFPVFFNPETLNRDSTLFAITNSGKKAREDWVEFVCPSRSIYRNAMKEQLSGLISSLDPDGVSIDFIRQFVYWEKIYPDREFTTIEKSCYCDSCISMFSAKFRISIPDSCETTAEKAEWIETRYSSSFDSFRCDLITSMVRELSEEAHNVKKEILVNVHLVPWRNNDYGNGSIRIAGQDLRSIEPYTDYASPMCYSQMLDRDAEWISDVVKDMDIRAMGKILPSIQVFPYYIDRSFTAADFRLCLEEALKPPSEGVVFFSWPLFEKDSARMEVVRKVVKELN